VIAILKNDDVGLVKRRRPAARLPSRSPQFPPRPAGVRPLSLAIADSSSSVYNHTAPDTRPARADSFRGPGLRILGRLVGGAARRPWRGCVSVAIHRRVGPAARRTRDPGGTACPVPDRRQRLAKGAIPRAPERARHRLWGQRRSCLYPLAHYPNGGSTGPGACRASEALSLITGLDIANEDLEQDAPEGFEAGPTERPEDEDVSLDPDEEGPAVAEPGTDQGLVGRKQRAFPRRDTLSLSESPSARPGVVGYWRPGANSNARPQRWSWPC